METLDRYVTTAPSPQNAVDIFAGSWSTSFTEPLEHVWPHYYDAELIAGMPHLDVAAHHAAEQQAYIARLEQAVRDKDAHIAELKRLIERVENGRVMRLLKLLER